jgi:cell division protein FtsB
MNQQVPDEDFIRRYLLGELTEDAQRRIEERLFAEDEFYEYYLTAEDRVEDELIDQYVGGEMSPQERERFDRIFLSTPQRIKKLKLVQALHGYVNSMAPGAQERPPQQSFDGHSATDGAVAAEWWSQSQAILTRPQRLFTALALILLLAAVFVAPLYIKSRRLEAEMAALRSQQQPQPTPGQNLQQELSRLRASNDELAASLRRAEEERALTEQRLSTLEARARETAGAKPRSSPSRILSLALPLLRDRGAGQVNPLKPSPGTTYARLLLGLGALDFSGYKSFQAEVSEAGGSVVLTRNGLRASTVGEPHVTLTVPVRRLPDGDYVVRLRGLSESGEPSLIGAYDFRVTR